MRGLFKKNVWKIDEFGGKWSGDSVRLFRRHLFPVAVLNRGALVQIICFFFSYIFLQKRPQFVDWRWSHVLRAPARSVIDPLNQAGNRPLYQSSKRPETTHVRKFDISDGKKHLSCFLSCSILSSGSTRFPLLSVRSSGTFEAASSRQQTNFNQTNCSRLLNTATHLVGWLQLGHVMICKFVGNGEMAMLSGTFSSRTL